MAAKNIGYVSELIGSAQIRTEEGVIKLLHVGDVVQNGDVLLTGVNSQVVVTFYSGHKVEYGANSEVLLDETVFSEQVVYSDQQVDQLDEVAAFSGASGGSTGRDGPSPRHPMRCALRTFSSNSIPSPGPSGGTI